MRSSVPDANHGRSSPEPPAPKDTLRIAAGVMELHWNARFRYTPPNPRTYPWLWLWDSCFHALIWDALGDARAVDELASVFDWQHDDGFVPHMGYHADPPAALVPWGRHGASTITQPPMYGHAIRMLAEHGHDVNRLHRPVAAGLRWLLANRQDPGTGLVHVVHPWETGADDTPRWARWQPQPFDRSVWGTTKAALVRSLVLSNGAAVANPAFAAIPASFNALVAFNLIEAGEAAGDRALTEQGRALADRVDELLWDEDRRTWVDVLPTGEVSSRSATVESALGVLVTTDHERRRQLLDLVLSDDAYGGAFGPAGVRRDEPGFDPDGYWRGGAWPQITYLLGVSARRGGLAEHAERFATLLRRGAEASGFAEHWNPDTGAGSGAQPQSWTCLAAVPVADARRPVAAQRPRS